MRWVLAFFLIPGLLVALNWPTCILIDKELMAGFTPRRTDTEALYLAAAIGYASTFLFALPASICVFLYRTAPVRRHKPDPLLGALLRSFVLILIFCSVVLALTRTGATPLAFVAPLSVLIINNRHWKRDRKACSAPGGLIR